MKGLANLGDTCYFGAALQALLYAPNATNYFLAGLDAGDLVPRRKLASALAAAYAELVRAYWRDPGHAADPAPVHAAFVRACRSFARGQHDAHEALVCLLDRLHEGLGGMKPGAAAVCPNAAWARALGGKASVVSEVFRGQTEHRVASAGGESLTHDHFTSVSVPVAPTLGQSFKRAMDAEPLEGYEMPDGSTGPATLRKRFTYLPRVLVVHLKRFGREGKVDQFVEYPFDLDLGQFAAPGVAAGYRLFAVCLHRGSSDRGHYAACGEVQGRWFAMDDERCQRAEVDHVVQRDAYVLLYKRVA